MVDIQAVSIAIASVGVLAASIYYSFQIRHQTRLRQTDIIMRLNTQWDSEGFFRAARTVLDSEFKDFDDFTKKYNFPSQNDVTTSYAMIGNFFEGLGVLLSEKLIDINLCQKLFDVGIYWEKTKPIVIGLRKQLGKPTLYEWFEYLYNEMQKRELKLQQSAA
jgi:hypothetical protein